MAGWSTSSVHSRAIRSMVSERRAHGRKAAEDQRHNLVWHMQHPTSHHSMANLRRPNHFSAPACGLGHLDERRSRKGDSSGAVRSTDVCIHRGRQIRADYVGAPVQQPPRFASEFFFDSYCISRLKMSLLPGGHCFLKPLSDRTNSLMLPRCQTRTWL